MDLRQRHLPHHVSLPHIHEIPNTPLPSMLSSPSTGSSTMWSLLEIGPSLSGQTHSADMLRLLSISVAGPPSTSTAPRAQWCP